MLINGGLLRLTENRSWSIWIDKYPLQLILAISFFVRLLAVIFSKGFGMLDDHFLVIEAAQSWADNTDYNNWLPKEGQSVPTPSGHSFFYAGLHFLLFKILHFAGVDDPQIKMLIVRLIHAIYSMITIYCGYRIAEKTTDIKTARLVGLLLGLLWFWPFLCVRNLVEVACIPMLAMATWLIVKDPDGPLKKYLIAGIFLALAFNIRFQSILFALGFCLALLLTKKFLQAIVCATGLLLGAALIQGSLDYFIWKQPFVEFGEYVRYNVENANTYGSKPWYNYIPLILGILIPPVSLFLFFGFFSGAKKHLLLFLPSFVFLVFHSYFPNKQERFILPIIPFIIILGCIGWYAYSNKSTFWNRKQKWISNAWMFFWLVNIIPLVVVSLSYSKKNRVEAMVYLSERKDVQSLLIEDSNSDSFIMSPNFYLGKWVSDYGITKSVPVDSMYSICSVLPEIRQPNYVLFYQEKNLTRRMALVLKYYQIQYLTTIYPSFIDHLMFTLNPRNVNQTTYIFKLSKRKAP